jgi:hypothetical protein
MSDTTRDWLDDPPPADPSRAAAYWCEMSYFMAHVATGDHPPCRCPEGMGHNAAAHHPGHEEGATPR